MNVKIFIHLWKSR